MIKRSPSRCFTSSVLARTGCSWINSSSRSSLARTQAGWTCGIGSFAAFSSVGDPLLASSGETIKYLPTPSVSKKAAGVSQLWPYVCGLGLTEIDQANVQCSLANIKGISVSDLSHLGSLMFVD